MTDRIISIRLPGFHHDRVGPVAITIILGLLKVRRLGPHLSVKLT